MVRISWLTNGADGCLLETAGSRAAAQPDGSDMERHRANAIHSPSPVIGLLG